MQPISAIPSTATQAASRDIREPEPTPRSAAGLAPERTAPAVTDEYVKSEPSEPTGRYWPVRGADGKPAVRVDGSGRANAGHGAKEARHMPGQAEPEETAGSPKEQEPEKATKRCTVNTDRVDREIEKLKRQKAELEKRLRASADKAQTEKLRTKFDQIERELAQKDNDAYRRQHAEYASF